jgi:hypothetical protein
MPSTAGLLTAHLSFAESSSSQPIGNLYFVLARLELPDWAARVPGLDSRCAEADGWFYIS